MDPKLPDLAAKHSFGYGSSTTQKTIPGQMSDQSGLNVTAMAASIESGVKHAQDRDEPQEESRNTSRTVRGKSRSKRSVSASVSPVRRGRNREPTPDQVQLLGTLREVTVSPNADGDDDSQQDQSTPTPTPPIAHALSTASSPPPAPPESILPSNEPLYPPLLLQRGSPIYQETSSWRSPQYEGDIDNESILSYNLEREVHEDDLKRTHPITFREQPQGKNITAPPRRFSGRAFANETIQEEDEPISEPSIEKSPTPRPRPEVQTRNEVPPRPRSEPRSEPEHEPEPFTAPTRTIIPRSDMRETSFHEPSPPSPPKSGKSTFEAGIQAVRETSPFQKGRAARIVAIILLAAASIFTTYWFSDSLADISRGITPSFPFGKQSPYIPFNATGMDAINSLSKHVARIDTRVSSLSGELDTVRSDVENIPPPTTIIEPAPVRTTTPTPKGINFLTHGMGVTIDHSRTSPTVGQASNFWRRTSLRMHEFYDGFFATDSENKQSPPPLMALMPWEDVGDCWCSTPESGVSQLSVELGRQIVPEDVVVEHMPKEATIKPEVAPQEMELWARFVVKSDDSAGSSSSWIPSFLSSSKKPSKRSRSSVPSDQFSLHEYVMETLRNTWRGEPDTSFSDDELLGPSFYRIGRWTYDINRVEHIQEFSLDTIMYSIRVDHVVFRVKSNWGGNDTCLYRLRLYGQL